LAYNNLRKTDQQTFYVLSEPWFTWFQDYLITSTAAFF